MNEDDMLDRYSTAPAKTLPEGWEWRHYGDGSGSLRDPGGKAWVSYDRQPYANACWVEYQFCVAWSLFQDSFEKFIGFAENLVRPVVERGEKDNRESRAAAAPCTEKKGEA